MKRSGFSLLTSIAAFGILVGADAHAQTVTIVDQSQTTNINNYVEVLGVSPVGQSFTPTLPSLNFVTLAFDQPTSGSSVQIDILSGAGTSGAVLGTSQSRSVLDFNFGSGLTTTFTFTTPVALPPTSSYTMRIDYLQGAAYIETNYNNPYSGGQLYLASTARTEYDLYFVEGLIVPAPEPSSVAALAVGALGLSALGLRARRRSAV